MAKSKVGRATLLRMEADLAEAEEAFAELKAKRPVCDECGRPKPKHDLTAAEKKTEAAVEKARVALREQRKQFREADGR